MGNDSGDDERPELAYYRDFQKRRRAGAAVLGKCISCCIRYPSEGKTCDVCKENVRAYLDRLCKRCHLAKCECKRRARSKRKVEYARRNGWKWGKAHRLRCLAKGICPGCGDAPVIPGLTYCIDCKELHIEYTRAARIRKRAEGICEQCPRRARKHRRHCRRCAARIASALRRRYAAAAAAGQCIRCREPHDGDTRICRDCLDLMKLKREEREHAASQRTGA